MQLRLQSDPSLFTLNGSGAGQVAAYNFVDGTTNTSANPVARGQTIILYGTGLGPVSDPPPDGQQARPAPSRARAHRQACCWALRLATAVRRRRRTCLYSGLSSLVGVWQINLTIPSVDTPRLADPGRLRSFQNSISEHRIRPRADPRRLPSRSNRRLPMPGTPGRNRRGNRVWFVATSFRGRILSRQPVTLARSLR